MTKKQTKKLKATHWPAHTHPQRSRDPTKLSPGREKNVTHLEKGQENKSWIRRFNMQPVKTQILTKGR